MTRLSFAGIEIRPDERRLIVDDEPAAIGARAFDLLLCLVEHRDRVVTRASCCKPSGPGS